MSQKKTFLVAAFIGVAFLAPVAAKALTLQEIQSQIQSLQQLIAALQAQLAILSPTGSTPSAPTTSAPASLGCINITVGVRMGMNDTMTGGQISALQRFLKNSGEYTYPEITGYFGKVTQDALQKWQTKYIGPSNGGYSSGYGAVGQRTSELIASQSCATAVPTPTSPTGPVPVSPLTCIINGNTISDGQYIQMYLQSNLAPGQLCADYQQSRQCKNGTLTGDAAYKYSACAQTSTASACTIGGITMRNGETRTFYSVPSTTNGSCSSYALTRACSNGTLTGDSTYLYAGCTSVAAQSCTLDGKTVASGSSMTFYSTSTLAFGASCSPYGQTRTCTNGSLSGTSEYNKASCVASAGSSCILDGTTVLHATSTTFYLARTIPKGESCSSYAQKRSCANGTLDGHTSYLYSSCAPVSDSSCALDNYVVPNGSSTLFYSAAAAPVGATCASISLARSCSANALSGEATYNRKSCTEDASCLLDGVLMASGVSNAFYSARTVAYGVTCSSISQTRSCFNGKLSGTEANKYSTCAVNPPTALVPFKSQIASALSAALSILENLASALRSF